MKFNNDKFLNNSGWDLFQQLYVTIASFLVGVFSVRILGPTNYGVIGIVNAILLFVAAISWLGFDSIVVNELVVNKDKEEKIVGTVFFSKIILSFLILPLFYLFVYYVYNNTSLCIVYIIISISQIFQSNEIIHWWLQSKQNNKAYSIANIISYSIVVIFQIYIILLKKNVYWFAVVQTLYGSLLFISLLYIYSVKYKKKLYFSKYIFKALFDKGSHYIISALSITIYMQIDKLMIGKMISETQSGCYNAAVNIAVLWQFVPIAIINAAKPILFEYKSNDDNKFIYIYKRLIFYIVLLSFLFCIFIFLFAKYIVFFLYGHQYIDAITSLKICTWATLVSMIGVLRSVWIVANEYNRYDKYFTVIAAVINIVLNYIGIKCIGIAGAAISTLLSYLVEVFLVNYLFKDTQLFNRIFIEAMLEFRESIKYAYQYLKRIK